MKIKENEKRDKYLDLARESKFIEHDSDDDITCKWRVWNALPKLGNEAKRVGDRRMSRKHPNYSIAKISQNNAKSLEDLM